MVFEEILGFIVANKELFKVFYALIISFICALVVLKTDRMFKVSDYQGLRYLRNAFFFYGIAFIVRFILGGISVPLTENPYYISLVMFLFRFFIIGAGLFLLYSLIWKKMEKGKQYHSFFNLNILVIYSLSLILALLDIIFQTYFVMYISNITLFSIMAVISYKNLKTGSKKTDFRKYYFLAIIIGLFAWVLNAVLDYFLMWNNAAQIQLYGMHLIFFLIFLYGIIKTTNKNE